MILLGCRSPQGPGLESGIASQSLYHEASATIWEDYKTTAKFEAKVLTLTPRLIDAPADMPISRLTIRNITTGRTIFQRNIEFRPVSMHPQRLLMEDEALVCEWEGGSASSIMIIRVKPASARVILDEAYRVGVSFISSNGANDVYITSGCCGIGPFYTTRFVYNGKYFNPAGSMAYEDFRRLLTAAFPSTEESNEKPNK